MTYVYAIRDAEESRVKIGFSENPRARLREIGSDLELMYVIPGDRQTEKTIHLSLVSDALGGEWFTDSPAVRGALAAHGPAVPFDLLPEPTRSILIRASLSDHEWLDIRKTALDRGLHISEHVARLIRKGQECEAVES